MAVLAASGEFAWQRQRARWRGSSCTRGCGTWCCRCGTTRTPWCASTWRASTTPTEISKKRA
ncbi:hypothetical protein Fmac_025514 [Flemingia macrophylla]|uniref:Uncharacterized protein n=1 Tax=Flemingia macrophylla TaxID=520843 RepID=A0ABD1LSF2_9FABA